MKLAIIAATTFVATLGLSTAASAGTCRDPWITEIIKEVTGREPNGSYESGECTYTQYRGGSWNSKEQLRAAIQAKFPLRVPAGLSGGSGSSGIARGGGGTTLSGSVSTGSGISGSASGMVAAGGGNMVAAGGGNMVAAGGGN